MRQAVLNGPTLSPQGQIPSSFGNGLTNPPAAPPAPGLRESSGRPASSNGSMHPVEQRNGYHLESTSVSLVAARPVSEASNQGNEKSSPTGWSARYSSSQTTQPSQRPQYSPPLSNPYHNSFERQRPTSSHATYNGSSPTKNPSSLSSPHLGENGVYSQMPYANGISAANLPPATPQLPSYSPVKQQSSPPMLPVQMHQQSPSSPSNHHPRLHQNAPSSPGFSPTKHSPPPRSFGPGEVTNTPVLPPVENLSPSPQLGNPPPPVKVANGDTYMHTHVEQ